LIRSLFLPAGTEPEHSESARNRYSVSLDPWIIPTLPAWERIFFAARPRSWARLRHNLVCKSTRLRLRPAGAPSATNVCGRTFDWHCHRENCDGQAEWPTPVSRDGAAPPRPSREEGAWPDGSLDECGKGGANSPMAGGFW